MGDVDDIASAVGSTSAGGYRPSRRVPTYRAILTGATILRLFAAVFVVVGLLFLATGVMNLVFWWRMSERHDLAFFQLIPFITAGVCGIVAAFIAMTAWVAMAIRDIAINSFQQ